MRYFLFAAFFAALFSTPAFAACTGPAGQESQTRYDFATHKMLFCDGADWVEMGGGGGDTLTALGCAPGQGVAMGASAWECVAPAPAPAPTFYYCTNEQTDGDGTGDVAACVGAKTNTGAQRYRTVSCERAGQSDIAAGIIPNWNGSLWRVWANAWANCVDGTTLVVDTQTNGGGGGGTLFGGYRWYKSASNQNCDDACDVHGGCNLAGIRNYAGSDGSNANCLNLLNALGGTGSGAVSDNSFLFGTGCAWDGSDQRFRATSPATTCAAYASNTYRACACNN